MLHCFFVIFTSFSRIVLDMQTTMSIESVSHSTEAGPSTNSAISLAAEKPSISPCREIPFIDDPASHLSKKRKLESDVPKLPLKNKKKGKGKGKGKSKATAISLSPILPPPPPPPPTQSKSPNPPPAPAEPLSEYTCPICFFPPTNATLTPCGHVCCGSCLFTAIKTTLHRGASMGIAINTGENVPRCPVCRAVIRCWDGRGGGVIGLKVRIQ